MYAIVKSGGKQYRVEAGQRLLVERLPVKEGGDLELEALMYRSEETVLDKAGLEKVKVTAKVIEHVRGEKLRVLKFKPKRGYKRRTGHRQALTRIEVAEITTARRAASTAEDKAKQPAKATEAKAKRPAKPAAEGRAKAAAKPRQPRKAPAKAKAKPAEEQGDGA